MFWKLAKVEELIQSDGNIVRSVMVPVLNNNEQKSILLQRPIQQLIAVEVHTEPEARDTEKQSENLPEITVEQSDVVRIRPKCNAAVIGEIK